MVQKAYEEIQVDASSVECMNVISDFERYPDWVPDIKEVEILRRDADGRGNLVAFRAAAIGRNISYSLEYFYGENPFRCAWQLKEGELLRILSGKYEFEEIPDEPEKTFAKYDLAVDLKVPLASFVKRRLETRLLHAALSDFKTQVEIQTV